MNDSPGNNHWLELKLEGTKSNRDGIGARIRISAAGHAQFNHMSTAAGYLSSSAGPIHFSLGQANKVEEIEIRWPSGTRQAVFLSLYEPGTVGFFRPTLLFPVGLADPLELTSLLQRGPGMGS